MSANTCIAYAPQTRKNMHCGISIPHTALKMKEIRLKKWSAETKKSNINFAPPAEATKRVSRSWLYFACSAAYL